MIFHRCFFFHYRELGDNVNEEELKAMIDEFDLDGDGESKKIFCFVFRIECSFFFI